MAAHRPIAHRAFSVLLVALLLGSVVAPIAASSPAAAQTSDTESCLTSSTYLLTSCAAGDISTTSYDGDAAATQTTLHGFAVSEWESQKTILTILENYGEDTESIASLEGRNAIATAYEQGNSSTTADQMARDEIQDYYSQRQINTLEAFSKSSAQFDHIGNVTSNESDLVSDFLSTPSVTSSEYNVVWTNVTGLSTQNYTLANGTVHEYQAPVISVQLENPSTNELYGVPGKFVWHPGMSHDLSDEWTRWPNNQTQDRGTTLSDSPQLNVEESYTGTSYAIEDGLPAQKVHQLNAWEDTLGQWSNQSATMTTNYVDIASDLYSEMDAGNLDPNELRGAEGMVRYLSGDSNATEGDYRTALHYTLDTSNPNLTETSTMKVHIDGYTGLTWNESVNSTSREPIPTDPMNGTVEGLLFADGVDSVSVNQTYSTTATDNKSFYMVDENGTQTTLIDGNLTVEAIYDADGNEVENATYSDPKYSSYNATDFINYLEKNEEVRAAIISDDSSGGGVTIGDLFGGNPAIGLVVVGAIVALFIAGKASN